MNISIFYIASDEFEVQPDPTICIGVSHKAYFVQAKGNVNNRRHQWWLVFALKQLKLVDYIEDLTRVLVYYWIY